MEIPTYLCSHIESPITIDGDVTKPAWSAIESVPLIMHDGSGSASQETWAKLCWDNENLYTAFWCADTDIWNTFTKRDEPVFEQDAVEIFINPSADLKRYYEIELSPCNVIYDLDVTNPHGDNDTSIFDGSWDCPGIQTAVKVNGTVNNHETTDKWWSAEMAFPFSSLLGAPNTPPKDGDTWRFNLYRIDMFPVEEYNCWSPTMGPNGPDFHIPTRFGKLVFKK